MCINIAVHDVIAALPGRSCSMQDVIKALPDIDRESVKSAVHRLSDKGLLVARHNCFGFMYSMAPGATRRLMVAAGHARANNRRAALNLAPPRCAAEPSG